MNSKDRRPKPAAAKTEPAEAPDYSAVGLAAGPLVLTPAEGKIAELRMAAADYVQRAIGCELDDSEESLAFVDHYLDSVRHEGELRDEVVQLVAVAIGVYLGEVTRTKFGGRWVALPPAPAPPGQREPAAGAEPLGETPILDSIDEPVGWRLQLAAVPLLVDPIGMAQRALKRPSPDEARELDSDAAVPGESEDPVGFATTPELTPPLRAALGRLPPVSYDYYYSLTGRFETLSYVVELIAELQEAQRRAASPKKAEAAEEAEEAEEADEAEDPPAKLSP